MLKLIDKYDFAFLREKCAQFLINSKVNPLFTLRIADTYGLAEVEVKIFRLLQCLFVTVTYAPKKSRWKI